MSESQRSLTERIAYSGISYVIVTLSGFLGTIYLARVLGASALGVFALGLGIIKWLRIADLGVNSAIEKRVSEGTNRGEHLSAGLIIQSTLATVVVVGMLAFRGQINTYVGKQLAWIIGLLFVTDYLLKGFVVQAIRGCQRVHITEGMKAIEQVLRVLFQVTLVVVGYGVFSLFAGMALSLVTIALLGIGYTVRYTDLSFAMPSRRQFRSLYDFSKYSVIGNIKSQVFAWLDILILGFFVVDAQIGIYNVAWTLAMSFVLMGYAIRSNFFPEISSIATEGNNTRVSELFSEGLLYSGLLPIPGCVGAFLLGSSVLNIYGHEFQSGATVLVLLLLASFLRSYDAIVSSVLYGIDRPDLGFKMTVTFLVVNVGLNVALIPVFGIAGAAIATIAAIGASLVIGWWLLKTAIEITLPTWEVGKQVLAALVMGVVIAAVKQFLIPDRIMHLLIVISLGGTVYFGVLLSISTPLREKALTIVEELPVTYLF